MALKLFTDLLHENFHQSIVKWINHIASGFN